MAMIIRKTDSDMVALCAAENELMDEDIYLDDVIDHAIRQKIFKDFISEGLINKEFFKI